MHDREIKVETLEFEGNLNPDDSMNWLYDIGWVFEFHSYSYEKKFRVAILKFKKYASFW